MPRKWAVALVMLNTGIMLALLVAHMTYVLQRPVTLPREAHLPCTACTTRVDAEDRRMCAGKVQSRTEVLARGAGYEIFKVQVRDDFLAHVSSFFRCEADSYRHDVCMHYCLRACAKNAAIALPTALSVLCAICRIPARMLQCRLGLRSAWLRGCRSVMNGWNPSPSQIRVTIMMILLALSSLNSSRYRFVLWSRRRHSFCRCRFCMNVCVCTHAHARTHARTHTHTHTHAHAQA